jgi:DNA mismatch repair protein MutS
MALTPMMKQYFEIKSGHEEEILMFRLGDFYEMFDKDALLASEILGITLTSRNKGADKMPMCGVPYHAANNYIAKLIRAGKKVAICDQVSDPGLPGIVKREVVRIITPGTTLDENLLENKQANFLASLVMGENGFSLAWADLSTGELMVRNEEKVINLIAIIGQFKPAELLVDGAEIIDKLKQVFPEILIEKAGELEDFEKVCAEHFGVNKLEELGENNLAGQNKTSLKALAYLIKYLQNTQKTELNHLKEVKVSEPDQLMFLDESTIRNLEILENQREKKSAGSLLSVLDKTVTNAGGRLLRKIIVQPLVSRSGIEGRLEMVGYLKDNQGVLLDLRLALKEVFDIERMLGRLSLSSGNARDLRGIANSLIAVQKVKMLLAKIEQNGLKKLNEEIKALEEMVNKLLGALKEELPVSVKEGGMIRDGFHAELDEYRNLSKTGKDFIQAMQIREIARTGINSLKVKYNRVFGYYIEISKANLKQVPDDYDRKQTLVNAERFTTPELKEYEEKVLTAEEKIYGLEEQLFEGLRALVLQKTAEIKQTAQAIAYLDVISTFALISWENKYVRPEIGENYALEIVAGRHPVIEKLNPTDRFISNDLKLDEQENLMLITGPNMGGKSTYLRQTALIVLMAHLGCFVPAEKAIINLVDRIFTRVGASDNLVKGQSTFWVEMEETAGILAGAGRKSLLILDEIGRGTSTFDGVSIAWGIMEYIHNQIGAKTLFASHYHELIGLADKLPQAVNYSVKVEENERDGVVFLYKIARGGVDKSYGIEVAKLAGLPGKVVERAREILQDLEGEKIGESFHYQMKMELGGERMHGNLGLDNEENEKENLKLRKLENQLKEMNINELTPLEALLKLQKIKADLE